MVYEVFNLVLLFFFFFLLQLHHSIAAQTNITLGSFLIAGDDKGSGPWLSPSEDFAFGFNQMGSHNNGSFLLSIWYHKIPETTVVWYAANGTVPRGSKFELDADRGAVLIDPEGGHIWSSSAIYNKVSTCFLDDSGNFGLRNENSDTVWETFANPTDTILPGQEIGATNGMILSSRRSDTNYSTGRYRMDIRDGILQLVSVNLPSSYTNEPYYKSATDNAIGVGLNGTSGYLYLVHQDGQRSRLTGGNVVSGADYYVRATLEFDGVFIQYYYPKASTDNGTWSVVWSIPDNICTSSLEWAGVGVCGHNRICRLDINKRPICDCPRGFSMLYQDDDNNGCLPNYVPDCRTGPHDSLQDKFVLDEVSNLNWPLSDYALLKPVKKDECRAACLSDCMCVVAVFNNLGECWKKKLPLNNGRVVSNVNAGMIALIKRKENGTTAGSPFSPGFPALPVPNATTNSKDALILAGSVLLGSSVFVNLVLIGTIGLGFFLIYRKKLNTSVQTESGLKISIHRFTYKELEDATDGFKEELGRGSFGVVYKGSIQIDNSPCPVAVKKVNGLFQETEREFTNEVLAIGQTHHKSLVRLLGYCNEGLNRLLVYEFLSNGTLASFLFVEDSKPRWKDRTQIALDIGRGLLYLHEDCSSQIIHCDIKPQNILLDEHNNARISDFGLAKLLLLNQTQTHTAVRGTRGYVAPEWFRNMPITAKVDVYSFGIMLLEIICCRRGVDAGAGGQEKAILADWAYDCYVERMLNSLVEHDLEAQHDMTRLERFVMVAIWCIQEDPSLRPSMKKVMLMLEGIIEVPKPPCPYPFSTTITVS